MEFNATFLATIISFLIFVYLMNKVLYEPVRRIVNERHDFIEGNYSDADNNNAKAEELSEKREEELKEAKDNAKAKYNELIDNYKNQKSEIVKNAQEETSKELEDAYNNLNNVSNEAKEKLKGSMTDLANDIVEKVIGYRSEIQGFDDEEVNKILYHKKGM
ncbi:F0F1 ATP synthase subunit B [bacterium]|nr:F0F1 ATP synthase subunit B [bacterium]